MEASLCDGDWRDALDLTAHELGAEGMVLICHDLAANTTTASVGSHPSIDFVLRCRELARRRLDGPQQCYALHLGFVSWACAESAPAGRQLTATMFALHRHRTDPAVLEAAAELAACCIGAKARLTAMRSAAALKSAAFDRLPFGAAIVDDQLRVTELNEACRSMFARGDGLRVADGRLHCQERGDQAALARAVSAALQHGLASPLVRVARPSGGAHYLARAIRAGGDGAAASRCMLLIVDPDDDATPANEIGRAAIDLTDGELIMAERIAAGFRS
jgi:hypothetical protein